MDFDYNETQNMLRANLRKFLAKNVAPIVDEYEANSTPVPDEIIEQLVPFGVFGATLPEENGGLGLDLISYLIMIEELSRVWVAARIIVTMTNSVIGVIGRFGTEAQKEKYLPDLLSGKKTGFMCLTEPNIGSDASRMKTKAREENDYYLLNGTKMFISNGSRGDIGIVFARSEDIQGPGGISAFIVDKRESEFKTSNIKKMGQHCSTLSEVVFEDTRVSKDNLVGNRGEGFSIVAHSFLNEGRVVVASTALGVAKACFERSLQYATEREQFGKPIGKFQLIQELLVQMSIGIEASELMIYKAADMLERGLKCTKECSQAKLFTTETAVDIAAKAIQLHGGYGYSSEFPLERYYRDLRHTTIVEGSSQIQTLIIGRELLGMSAFA